MSFKKNKKKHYVFYPLLLLFLCFLLYLFRIENQNLKLITLQKTHNLLPESNEVLDKYYDKPQPTLDTPSSIKPLASLDEKKISLLPKFEKQQKEEIFPQKDKLPEDKACIVIIVDDLGENIELAREIMSLKYPLTLSIIPHLQHSEDIAREAHKNGFEVIVHLPMEAEDEKYNKNNPLLIDMPVEKIEEITKDAFRSVPYSVGFNNHQGSKFTTSISALRNVLKVAKEFNFFYIDSLTSPYSVGELVAKGVDVRFEERDVFLDNIKEENYIRDQFRELVKLAKRKGVAVGICHPHRITYNVLKEEIPKLQNKNVELVFASEVVK